MRIFYACDLPNSSVSQSKLWHNNLFLPLVDLGYEVIKFDYDLASHFDYQQEYLPSHCNFIRKNRPKLESELLSQIRENHSVKPIDIFLSYFSSAYCSPSVIKEIKSLGITTINWFCNASFQFYLIKDIAPAYDYCLVPEKFKLQEYKQIGANPVYFPLAANPAIYRPYNIPAEYDVIFIGQGYGDRPEYTRYLLDKGINIRVWGSGWEKCFPHKKNIANLTGRIWRLAKKMLTPDGWRLAYLLLENKDPSFRGTLLHGKSITLPAHIIGESLLDDEMIKMYSRSKINLGFSTCGNTHQAEQRIVQVRLRDFEVPMCAGFYITEYFEELGEFFEYGKDIEGYTSKEELFDKCRFYLNNDTAREKICKSGFERAVKEHTWQNRFKTFFQGISR